MKLYSLKPRLKEIRKKNGLTQQQLADKMNVILKTVQNWEQGIAIPPFETIIQLCDLLKCDVDYLIGRIDCQTHDNQFIHDEIGLNEAAINKMRNLHKNNRASSFTDIISILIEHFNSEYMLDLIAEYISRLSPENDIDITSLSTKEFHDYINSNETKVNYEGHNFIVKKRNFIESLIQTSIISDLPEIAKKYYQYYKSSPKQRSDQFERFREQLIQSVWQDAKQHSLSNEQQTEMIHLRIDEYLSQETEE